MEGKNILKKYSVEEISSLVGSSSLDNFLISGGNRAIPELFLEFPHSIDGVAISICTGGYAKVKIALREYEIAQGTLMVLIPDLIIEPLKTTSNLSFKTIFFPYDFVSDLKFPVQYNIIEKIMALSCIPLSNQDYRTLLKYHSFIEEQYLRDIPKYKAGIIKYILFAMIEEIFSLYSIREAKLMSSGRIEQLANQFVDILLKNYKSEHNVSFYADKLCVSPKYLMTLIRQKTGKPISTWINSALITHSKRELKTSEKSILLISEELNFSSPSQFCRYFKAHTGMTPKQYRDSREHT
ncbi:MAG: helix-turn-helix transcriptional regulator [Tannerella sp.]|jgi:AraC-like DNA-binding protein|nr:helix-turn-helix transcriptional regulator [Tannerella sp.]